MHVRRYDKLNLTFVLRPKDLGKLDEIAKEIGDPRYEAVCADGLTRRFESVDEVLAFENPPDRKIQRLEIASYNHNSHPYTEGARFSFSNDKYRNVELALEGPESKVVPLNRDVEDFFERIKPWYGEFFTTDPYKTSYWFFFFVITLASISVLLFIFNEDDEIILQDYISPFFLGMLAGALIVFVEKILKWIGRKLFPTGTFAIGQGEDRHELRENIRWAVAIAFFVSLAGSIVVGLIL